MTITCGCGKRMEVPLSYPFECDPRCVPCQPLYAMFPAVYRNAQRLALLARYEATLASAITGD